MKPLVTLTSRVVVLPNDNVDTDQIIPARFLTTTTREGLGEHLFADWRKDPSFVLNRPETKGAQILVAGNNFACGSSREHAPWALVDFGFRAVVSTSIADIFTNNAVKNGLLPVEVDEETYTKIVAAASAGNDEVVIDLKTQTLTLPDGHSGRFPVEGFARHCLLEGIDQLDFILREDDAIAEFESHR